MRFKSKHISWKSSYKPSAWSRILHVFKLNEEWTTVGKLSLCYVIRFIYRTP